MNIKEATDIFNINLDAELKAFQEEGFAITEDNLIILKDRIIEKCKKQYRKLMIENHPDLVQGRDDYAKLLNEAMAKVRKLEIKIQGLPIIQVVPAYYGFWYQSSTSATSSTNSTYW